MTRAEKAGQALGHSIVEMIHLMYQNNTAKNFIKGLYQIIESEYKRRHFEKRKKDGV